MRPFIIAEDRRFVEVIEIADEKLHVVSANKEYFDKTVEGFKKITSNIIQLTEMELCVSSDLFQIEA